MSSFCLNSRVLHLSVIIRPAFRSKKLSSPHPPPLVPVDGATFVTRCSACLLFSDAAQAWMSPSYLRHMRYENRSRGNRGHVSLYRRNAYDLTRVQLRRHAGGKHLRCSWGFLVAGGLYVLICWSYIAGSTGGYVADSSAPYENQSLHGFTLFSTTVVAVPSHKLVSAVIWNWVCSEDKLQSDLFQARSKIANQRTSSTDKLVIVPVFQWLQTWKTEQAGSKINF